MNTRGQQAEALAAAYLQKQGLKLLATNYHCRFGEIDIVMLEGRTLVFVEVRMRGNPKFGSAAESITPAKQRKLVTTAQHYMQKHGEAACRFDTVLMTDLESGHLQWLKSAFDAHG